MMPLVLQHLSTWLKKLYQALRQAAIFAAPCTPARKSTWIQTMERTPASSDRAKNQVRRGQVSHASIDRGSAYLLRSWSLLSTHCSSGSGYASVQTVRTELVHVLHIHGTGRRCEPFALQAPSHLQHHGEKYATVRAASFCRTREPRRREELHRAWARCEDIKQPILTSFFIPNISCLASSHRSSITIEFATDTFTLPTFSIAIGL
jgi:hypothetical protein